VARRVGLGRGLAALLPAADNVPASGHSEREPEIDEQTPDVSTAAAPDSTPGIHAPDVSGPRPTPVTTAAFGSDLVSALTADDAGLGLLYRTLDALVDRFGLEDAVVVIDEAGLGRQVYRAGRRPIEDDETGLLLAPPGLYTEPEIVDPSFDPQLIVSLCTVAVRLELLRYDAWHDPLTGLFDRRSFDRLLEMAIARSRRHAWPFTLVLIDLDRFKALNDRFGHAAGDAALRELGARFRRVLRFDDNAARIGGDEFALVLPGTPPEAVPALLDRLQPPRDDLSFSWGMASCPAEATTVDELFQLADGRLYQQKQGRVPTEIEP
jgi:diguanylate cyclase (GGDEF)-like protein